MAEINLAPGTEYMGLLRKRRRRVYFLTILVMIIVAVAWGGLFVYREQLAQEKRDLGVRLSSVEAEITRLGDQATRVTLFEGRLSAVDNLLTQHIAWDHFLQDLERLLPPPALLNQLKVNIADSTVEIGGETPDLDIIAQTLASLVSTPDRPSVFTSATFGNVNRVQEDNPQGEVVAVRYEFGATLSFDPVKVRYGQ